MYLESCARGLIVIFVVSIFVQCVLNNEAVFAHAIALAAMITEFNVCVLCAELLFDEPELDSKFSLNLLRALLGACAEMSLL